MDPGEILARRLSGGRVGVQPLGWQRQTEAWTSPGKKLNLGLQQRSFWVKTRAGRLSILSRNIDQLPLGNAADFLAPRNLK